MSDPFLGQVIAVGFNFAPVGWHLCDGSLLPINQNTALFSLLGTTFGGDGQTTFGLPDLRGRTVLGAGQGPGLQSYQLGEIAGVESVTLISGQFASHTHALAGATTATTPTPGTGAVLGTPATGTSMYASAGASATLAGSTVANSPGGGTPHENRQSTATVTYIISLTGVYPSRS
ncbi:MAG TPA: tail fiber protein [Acetobacteraceae bacterium]|jgi:microcystin-dependent protein